MTADNFVMLFLIRWLGGKIMERTVVIDIFVCSLGNFPPISSILFAYACDRSINRCLKEDIHHASRLNLLSHLNPYIL